MYPLNWKADGRPCLVVERAMWRPQGAGLLAASACVTVTAPEASAEIQQLAEAGRIRYRKQCFAPGEERGFALVISTAGDEAAARYLSEAADAEGFLYNAADFPALGNCTLPAHFERGA